MSNGVGTVVGSAAFATVIGVTYYINNQIIVPIKEDLEKTMQEVYDIKKKTDIIDINNKNITEIAQLTKRNSELIGKLIINQTKFISSLTKTVIDIQKKLFMVGIPTKLIPKQYIYVSKENKTLRNKNPSSGSGSYGGSGSSGGSGGHNQNNQYNRNNQHNQNNHQEHQISELDDI